MPSEDAPPPGRIAVTGIGLPGPSFGLRPAALSHGELRGDAGPAPPWR